MYIKKIELLNFQVIEKFEADFEGNVYFITGDNELGKSTLLKAIGALLTGERDEVLRTGASKGFAKMIVGDDGEEFDVALSFTENNPRGTLTIKQKSTGMQSNNVSMLQKIFGYQDFDAVEFSRWSETAEGRRKQIAVVKSLLAPEIRERINNLETELSELKDERTGANRDVKTLQTFAKEIDAQITPSELEKYAAPIDITDLIEKQKANAALTEKAKTVRTSLSQRIEQLAEIPERLAREDAHYQNELERIDKKVADAKLAYEMAVKDADAARLDAEEIHKKEVEFIEAKRAELETRKTNCETWLADYEKNLPVIESANTMLANADAHNKKYALVCQFKEKHQQLNDAEAKVAAIEDKIKSLSLEHAGLILNSKLPVDGLTFNEDGLELNGIPFVPGKVSDSQIMEVATKLIIAANPNVKVFRIARGESLGAKRLETIIDFAKRNGFQGFIEQVKRGQTEMLVEEYTEK